MLNTIKFIRYRFVTLLFLAFSSLCFVACKKDGDNSINIFTIEDDKLLGKQLSDEIAADEKMYPVLDEQEYAKAYEHLYRIRDEILEAADIIYKDEFDWQTKIIYNDTIKNAFAGPAGYIYVYTGLIKFLDSEDHFAGILAHEIAHADRRHVTDQLTTNQGIEAILSLILGTEEPTALGTVTALLTGLQFSKAKEREADEYSVKYLCNTQWNANGASGFFQKVIDLGEDIGLPAFLSTHPNSDDRVAAINEKETELMCSEGQAFVNRYDDFKASLP